MGSIGVTPSDQPEFTPDLYPPFPSDTKPCFDLETLSLASLQAGKDSEKARLLSICKNQGFFYLDVSDTAARSLTEDAEEIARTSEAFFKLPLEDKEKARMFQKPYSLLGYKPAGAQKADAYGDKKDTAEVLNCGNDDIMETPGRHPTDIPAMFLTPSTRSLLARFHTVGHSTGLGLLSALALGLELPSDIFDDMHRSDRPSDSQIRLVRGPPRVSSDEPEIQLPGHTDFGSITLLFNWLGGLQVWSESNHGENFDNSIGSDLGPEGGRRGQWLWVKPKPGHVIVNLGDSAVKHTGGVLCAGRHRVLPAPGEQGKFPRYSVVYFVRPADDHVIRRFRGGLVPTLKEGETEEEMTPSQWATKQFQKQVDGVKKA